MKSSAVDGATRQTTPDSIPFISLFFRSGVALVVRRVKIEVNPAERPFSLGLAEDNRDLFIESDAVPKIGTAFVVRLDGLLHQGSEGTGTLFRRLLDADDVLLERS